MSATKNPVLANVKSSLEQMLAELNAMKMTICVVLTYVEQELEKEG